ncbi:unnamed protein product [Rotaria sp. Silwood2]|nr:unnamed protein product [Rotaria sp. Silwood2]CAF2644780.1 unnamed protein product [Rotaria sp. Silwood2]CAF2907750.1 unnamed protein product [Rotaria sp. Silwood2]CAF3851846.1 unnamed protein product [Rotaria sp. Silwood2]CAF3856034.1 unnamed protein product [Rotaria sp. Silwood2]
MFSSGLQSNFNIIEPIPRFFTIRFGCRKEIDDDGDDDDDHSGNNNEQKSNEIIRPSVISTNDDNNSSMLITGIRNRDWSFNDDLRHTNEKTIPNIKYQIVPSMSNTIKNRSTNFMIDNNGNQYEEYDLDEQDFQWLIAYNQFRIEKHLPELDENIFEYIMQLLEHQCLLAIRQKNYEDTIQCDACHRIDDVDDLIQCMQCKTIVHKKCYGIDDDENEWQCLSCQCDNDQHLCCLCDKSGGALKILKTSSDQKQWVHLSCAFWLPTVEFDEKMIPILKDTFKYDGRCLICNKTTGVKINCCWKNCQNRFHPLCAIDAGQDMIIAESDDKVLVRLIALCHRHTEKLDLSEKRVRRNKFLENQQKLFEQFTSYIDLESIKKQTSILPDILESIHTYWVLKRQANNGRPLIDIPDDIFYHGYNKNVNLLEFSRQYYVNHQHQTTNFTENKSNVLQFLTTNIVTSSSSNNNLFIKFARRNRTHFINYERNLFCLLDGDKKKREDFLESLSSIKENS